ncbi:sugar-binding protein [Photorhabdus luminescens]|nr:sugar-binding protein [Photorhabdus luminescens]
MGFLAIDQIAKIGLSSLPVIYYFENLFRLLDNPFKKTRDVFTSSKISDNVLSFIGFLRCFNRINEGERSDRLI